METTIKSYVMTNQEKNKNAVLDKIRQQLVKEYGKKETDKMYTDILRRNAKSGNQLVRTRISEIEDRLIYLMNKNGLDAKTISNFVSRTTHSIQNRNSHAFYFYPKWFPERLKIELEKIGMAKIYLNKIFGKDVGEQYYHGLLNRRKGDTGRYPTLNFTFIDDCYILLLSHFEVPICFMAYHVFTLSEHSVRDRHKELISKTNLPKEIELYISPIHALDDNSIIQTYRNSPSFKTDYVFSLEDKVITPIPETEAKEENKNGYTPITALNSHEYLASKKEVQGVFKKVELLEGDIAKILEKLGKLETEKIGDVEVHFNTSNPEPPVKVQDDDDTFEDEMIFYMDEVISCLRNIHYTLENQLEEQKKTQKKGFFKRLFGIFDKSKNNKNG